MSTKTGQIAITTILSVTSLFAAVSAPILWVGAVKEDVAVLQTKQDNTEYDVIEIKEDIRLTKDNVEYIRRAVEQMAQRQGLVVNEN